MSEVMPQGRDEVPIALLSLRPRVGHLETPVLTFGEERVRWRAGRSVRYKEVPFPPRVIAGRMRAQRQVKGQGLAPAFGGGGGAPPRPPRPKATAHRGDSASSTRRSPRAAGHRHGGAGATRAKASSSAH